MNSDTSLDLAFSDAVSLGNLLAQRKVSALELAQLYVNRLENYGSSLGAVVTIMHDRALREAKEADRELQAGNRRSPLHGVPYGAKDLLAAVGAPTTWGAQPYRDRYFDDDAAVIERLHAAGAVLCAKLAMVELAGGFGYNEADASFTGPGRTPWNRDYWSGGSSSGPGAATAAGLVGFAIGSETDGSIMSPSACCGVSGLRPTFGRVSRYGAMALMWSSDKLGPLCRSARDTMAILGIIAGRDSRDDTSRTMPFPSLARRPRIGIFKDATEKTQPAVVANFHRSVAVLRDFADVVEEAVTLPEYPYGTILGTLLNGEASAAFRDLIESGRVRELRSPEDRLGAYSQYVTLAVDYVDAMRLRKKANAAFLDILAPYDALIYPTWSTVAYPVGVPFDKAYPEFPGAIDPQTASNLAGVPAISIPNGFGDHGLPTAIAFIANAWSERVLTQIAEEYQQRTTFHTRRPPL